jgi:hypothetical protein
MTDATGYELSRKWFDFAFENPEKISPTHAAVYFFAIEHCNRLGWKRKFGFPTSMAMDAIGVKSYNTYIKVFNDLVDWGFFELAQKSKNQYSSNIIALSKINKALDKALDKALIKHATKQSESTQQSIDSINKQRTNKQRTINKEPLKGEKLIFDSFRKNYPGTKKAIDTEFSNFKKHKDWREVLPLLDDALKKQKEARAARARQRKFVPEWKNLQTWINQRCWEEEISTDTQTPKKYISEDEFTKHGITVH